jgi:hypothetical protein
MESSASLAGEVHKLKGPMNFFPKSQVSRPIISCIAFHEYAVPFTYPVDLFEHLWVVDRIERLGIGRHFTGEIKECLEYVHR